MRRDGNRRRKKAGEDGDQLEIDVLKFIIT
jgi:hypothetical protein